MLGIKEHEILLKLNSMPFKEEAAYIAKHPEQIAYLIAWLLGYAGLLPPKQPSQ